MIVRNIHERRLRASAAEVGALLDSLASSSVRVWPRDTWPAMRFDRPLAPGASGGHGPIRYTVEVYEPGRSIRFDEDALDNAASALGERPAPRHWPLRVRVLRRIIERRTRMHILALCLLFLALPYPAHAQRSGVLLGLRHGDPSAFVSETEPLEYRTLWLAPVSGELAVVVELPTLVVPRNDGFWRLDIESSCGITEATMEMEGPFVDRYTEPVWRKLGSTRTFVPGDGRLDCYDAWRQVRDLHGDTADEGLYAEPCNIRDVGISYASPELASFDTYSAQTEFCSPGRYTSRTQLTVVDTLQHTPSLMDLLTPARRAAVMRLWDEGKSGCTFEETPDENWGIVRGVGEWVTEFSSTGPTVCRGEGMADFDIRERIPAALARSEPAEWLSRLRRVVPSVDDYFVSPAGDLIVVRSGDELSAFTVERGELRDTMFRYRLRADERVILVEWATGSHVARWSAELVRSTS